MKLNEKASRGTASSVTESSKNSRGLSESAKVISCTEHEGFRNSTEKLPVPEGIQEILSPEDTKQRIAWGLSLIGKTVSFPSSVGVCHGIVQGYNEKTDKLIISATGTPAPELVIHPKRIVPPGSGGECKEVGCSSLALKETSFCFEHQPDDVDILNLKYQAGETAVVTGLQRTDLNGLPVKVLSFRKKIKRYIVCYEGLDTFAIKEMNLKKLGSSCADILRSLQAAAPIVAAVLPMGVKSEITESPTMGTSTCGEGCFPRDTECIWCSQGGLYQNETMDCSFQTIGRGNEYFLCESGLKRRLLARVTPAPICDSTGYLHDCRTWGSLINEVIGCFRCDGWDSKGVSPWEDGENSPFCGEVAAKRCPERKTGSPTNDPTEAPTEMPSDGPTSAPTRQPSRAPTSVAPTEMPSLIPTKSPTQIPTGDPTSMPTDQPSMLPTNLPSVGPTIVPISSLPTETPTTRGPTESPSGSSSTNPSAEPTRAPSTESPTDSSVQPSQSPVETDRPSKVPTGYLSGSPSRSLTQTVNPSWSPSVSPSIGPTVEFDNSTDENITDAPSIGESPTGADRLVICCERACIFCCLDSPVYRCNGKFNCSLPNLCVINGAGSMDHWSFLWIYLLLGMFCLFRRY